MKVIVLVIDGFGIGASEDAHEYGDTSANTYNSVGDEGLVNLKKLGLNNIDGIEFEGVENPIGSYGRMEERSEGKDTTTGHWEIAGLILEKPFPTYPKGFPRRIIRRFEKEIGRKTLYNSVASGTEIIKKLGDEHVRTGYPIVYTSADSVFQIAMHEDIIPLEQQREICKIARKILSGKHEVSRVIMRPFAGENGNYTRTQNRQDFAAPPKGITMLDKIKNRGYTTYAIGKIDDIFASQGITKSVHTHTNQEGLQATLEALKMDFDGLIFTNLVDTDMLYGHRRDVEGYKKSLLEIDAFLPKIMENMTSADRLVITSDHGCDPKFKGSDHTRESVPLLTYGGRIENLGTRKGFNFVSRIVMKMFV